MESRQYQFRVTQFDEDVGSQNYAVAWWYGLAPPLEEPIAGDVVGANLAQWDADYGLNADSDADNDGDSNGIDFLARQRNFGTGALSAATAVPEPGAAVLALVGMLLPLRPFSQAKGGRPNLSAPRGISREGEAGLPAPKMPPAELKR